MGKKKPPQNEFYFFMVERKSEIEKRMGRSVTMGELPGLLYAEWKSMSDEDKAPYRKMRENARGVSVKMDCRGVPLSEIRAAQDHERRKVEEMHSSTHATVEMLKAANALHRNTFYIVHVSYYVHTEEDVFVPAELAVLQFSFQKGIVKHFNLIIKPEIPLAYGYMAQLQSEKSHMLLEEDNDDAVEKTSAATTLKQFVAEEGGKLPPLYTLDTLRLQTEAMLDNICGSVMFNVYSLDLLLQVMYSSMFPAKAIPQSIATDMLTQCGLDYHPNLPCEWHQTHQRDAGLHCSLACVRRWFYHMCDNLRIADTFGITPQEGKHKPEPIPTIGLTVDVPAADHLDQRSMGAAGSSWTVNSFDDTASFSQLDRYSRKYESHGSLRSEQSQQSFSFVSKNQACGSDAGSKGGAWSNVARPGPAGINTTSHQDFPSLGRGRGYSNAARK